MTDFGWHYPPGAENDPNAPWNLPDAEPLTCNECGHEGDWDTYDGDDCPECDEGTMIDPYLANEPCRCYGDVCYC